MASFTYGHSIRRTAPQNCIRRTGVLALYELSLGSPRIHSLREAIYHFALQYSRSDMNSSVGTRHVKIWRLDEPRSASPTKQRFPADTKNQSVSASPSLKSLLGRNCLLGAFAESTFTCVARLPNDRAIVCSDKGDICLIEESEGNHRLAKIERLDSSLTCVAMDSEGQFAWIGDALGSVWYVLPNCFTAVLHTPNN